MKATSEQKQLLDLLKKYSPEGQDLAEALRSVEKHIKSSNPVVPILGMQGTGKSTLINALLGEDILPSEADETTCVPVEIRYGKEPSCEVYFSDRKERCGKGDKKDLQQYVDNQCNAGNEKKVDHLVLYRNCDLLKGGLILVDLPGLGSLTEENGATTKRYMQEQSAAILMLSLNPPLTNSSAGAVRIAWKSLNAVYFVQNVWDDLSEQEVQVGLEFNTKALQSISEEIQAPMLHPIISVNAYAAAKGALIQDSAMLEKSNVAELEQVLKDFAVHYDEKSAEALHARFIQCIDAACNEVERRIRESGMTDQELLAELEKEEKIFQDTSDQLDDKIRTIHRKARAVERQARQCSAKIARKYSELLRVKVFDLIDNGVVDGKLLYDASMKMKTEYAAQALDEMYEKAEELWQPLKEELKEFEQILQRDQMDEPKAEGFNKQEEFKWEKGMEAGMKIGGTVGSIWIGGAIGTSFGGPIGFVAGAGLMLVVDLLASASRKAVTDVRGNDTKSKMTPYIDDFKNDLQNAMDDSFNKFVDQLETQLESYRKERKEQLDAMEKRIQSIRQGHREIFDEISVLKQDKEVLLKGKIAND